MSDEDDLTSLMDGAMKSMLREIAKPESEITTADKVRIFAAATDWAALKLKIPAPKTESKFERLQQRLKPRGRTSGSGGSEAESGEA